jgi:hypothetical protein
MALAARIVVTLSRLCKGLLRQLCTDSGKEKLRKPHPRRRASNMANKQRGGRGRSRGKGAGFAQSGGKSTTFQGTGGGNAFGKKSGGSKGTKAQGHGGVDPANHYLVRNPGGDTTRAAQTGRVKPAPDLTKLGGPSMYDHKKPHVNKPVSGGH